MKKNLIKIILGIIGILIVALLMMAFFTKENNATKKEKKSNTEENQFYDENPPIAPKEENNKKEEPNVPKEETTIIVENNEQPKEEQNNKEQEEQNNIKENEKPNEMELIPLNYNESNLTYANPNRGFYTHLSFSLPSVYDEETKIDILDEVNYYLSAGDEEKLTMALLIITLDETLNKPITNDGLKALNDILEVLKENGYKVVIRFRYGRKEGTEPNDFSTMLEHIVQVGPILKKYADIIPVYQAGYIGAYGEWHTTKYDDVTYENQILDAMFSNSSELTEIAVREPKDYRNYLKHVNNNKDVIKRFGQYNDAFLSTYSDMGTYDNREEDIAYMSPITENTFYGGETVYAGEEYANLVTATKEMRLLHTNYLNLFHDLDKLAYWEAQIVTADIDKTFAGKNGLEYVFNRIGYRFVLRESKLTKTVMQGKNLKISFSIENTGFGNPIGINNTYLLLEKDGYYYRTPISFNPATILCDTTKKYELEVKLPFALEASNWNVYIQMSSLKNEITAPDKEFVKFANYDLYNGNIKANYIGTINVLETNNKTNTDIKPFTEEGNALYTVIDGKNTTDKWNTEWLGKDLVYNEAGIKVYAKIKENYLHIFVIDNVLKPTEENTPYINLLFDTGLEVPYKYDKYYTFRYENHGFFGKFNENNKFISLPITYKYSALEGYEYKIKLYDMNITKMSDIKKMRVSLYDKNWESKKRIVIEF
jgi:hypothetical protein